MIKILDSKITNFETKLNTLLSKRKDKTQLNSISVIKIIRDVKKNGDKAVLKYEKKFNKNSIIVPNNKKITRTILSLNPKIKNLQKYTKTIAIFMDDIWRAPIL